MRTEGRSAGITGSGHIRRVIFVAAAALACLTVSLPAVSQERQALRVVGGVGYRQFIRIALWLADNLARQPDAPEIWFNHHFTGRGFRDSLLRLAEGDAELALVNSRSVAAMAVRGKGLFDRPLPNVRAIAALPHYDWALFAVDAKLGVRSISDLATTRTPIRLATGYLDGDSAVGFVAEEILRRHDAPAALLERGGGELLPGGPGENRADMLSGRANAVLQEGARGEDWEALARERPLTFLSLDPGVAAAMERELGFGWLEVPAGYYPGQASPFLAADFSDWLICVRDDLPDDVAYRLAQVVIEQRTLLDQVYSGEPPRYSSINYPLEPRKLVDTAPVPLHPGAARYYAEHGITSEDR